MDTHPRRREDHREKSATLVWRASSPLTFSKPAFSFSRIHASFHKQSEMLLWVSDPTSPRALSAADERFEDAVKRQKHGKKKRIITCDSNDNMQGTHEI
jgi:hypothetical protein